MRTKPPGPKAKPKINPLAGYVALVTYLRKNPSEEELENLIGRELEGKRRADLIHALASNLFMLRKQKFLLSIGVPYNGKRILT